MLNRLVAQNIVKTPFKGQPYFSINKKFLAYSQQQIIKLKGFNKDIKDSQIQLQNNLKVKQFAFSKNNNWLSIINSQNILQLYQLQTLNLQNPTKILTVKGVLSFTQSLHAYILNCTDSYYRVLPFNQVKKAKQSNQFNIKLQTLYSLSKITQKNQVIKAPESSNIFIHKQSTQSNKHIITVYSLNEKLQKYQKTLETDYIHKPIAVYKNRYILQLINEDNNSNRYSIQIYDINQSKLIGKFFIEGEFRFAKINQNLLLIIMSVQNTDNYYFYMLNNLPNEGSPIITHKINYQKGKADYYDFFNMSTQQALSVNDKNKHINNDFSPQILDATTSSIIYVLNKQKQKVQVIKFQHLKLLQNSFQQVKVEKKMVSNTIINKYEQQKKIQAQIQRSTRIKSSLQSKNQTRTLQQTQKKFVQAIVDNKIQIVLKKFQQLQQRVERLEKTIKGIYEKIQQNMKDMSRKQIKETVQNLFQQLTPQFQKYFGELFKQVSGVLDQGVNFYNKKLAAEAQIHKQALTQIVSKTFDSTKDIIQLSKKQQKLSERTEKNLSDILQSRVKWQKKTQEFEQKNKQLSFTVKGPKQANEGKIFVKAVLHSAKKQT